MGFMREIIGKIILEIKCYRADNNLLRTSGCTSCFEMYPPSFYIRYTPEQQKQIYEKDMKKLKHILDQKKTEVFR